MSRPTTRPRIGDDSDSAPRSSRARGASLLALAALVALATSSLATAVEWRDALRALWGRDTTTVWIAIEALALAVVGTALFLEIRRPIGTTWWPLVRRLVVAFALGWIAFLALVVEYEPLWARLAVGPWAALFAALTIAARLERTFPTRLARATHVTLFTGAAAVLLLELGLRACASVRPTTVLARGGSGSDRVLEAQREAPGALRFGFRCNESGHYDGDFARRASGETRIATIGDSFAQGVVPHSLHFTTVAERALGCLVDNYGFTGLGVWEYERLLVDEILLRDPSLVVVCLFVGNDVPIPLDERRSANGASAWLARENVLVWTLPGRLARIRAERARMGSVARVVGERGVSHFPWTDDPSLESPTFSAEGFLQAEAHRLSAFGDLGESQIERCVVALSRLRDACGSIPFAVMLIPDEVQVEDALWSEVTRHLGRDFERDAPQAHLAPRLISAGVRVLDLLPILRAAAPLADGKKHVYHLQDTHWNARGNQLAGEALAEFARSILAR